MPRKRKPESGRDVTHGIENISDEHILRDLDVCANRIHELCDSVAIIVTRYNPLTKETYRYNACRGNRFALMSSVEHFLIGESDEV